ncbi:VOC family protein [bacterium]|nr:VOC family protein [bacterium]
MNPEAEKNHVFVQHIAFNCIDRKAQEEFYQQHLGFRRVRVINAGQANEFVMLRQGNTCMEFFSASSPASGAGEQSVGFKHLAFQVTDLERKVREIEDAGIQTQGIKDCSHITPGMRVCFFKDPEGNILELMEGWQDDKSLA